MYDKWGCRRRRRFHLFIKNLKKWRREEFTLRTSFKLNGIITEETCDTKSLSVAAIFPFIGCIQDIQRTLLLFPHQSWDSTAS